MEKKKVEGHLSAFRVDNFKRFDSLELTDIGQFNLIFGDNNVGKTSVLEALLFNHMDYDIFSKNLLYALSFKNIGKSLKVGHLNFYLNKNAELQNNQSEIIYEFDLGSREQHEIILSKTSDDIDTLTHYPNALDKFGISKNTRFDHSIPKFKSFTALADSFNAPFIPFYLGFEPNLVDLYSRFIQTDRSLKQKFMNALRILIPSIENLEISISLISEPTLVITQKDVNAVMPLATFGDGVIKLFRILVDIIAFKNGRLMIDEIDSGIHYSRFKTFWKAVLTAASENNVQLFATTHNSECIRSFKEILAEDLSDLKGQARGITLIENPKDHDIKAFTYTFEQMNHAIEVGNEIRGGYS